MDLQGITEILSKNIVQRTEDDINNLIRQTLVK